jgi:hypothetical protein
LLITLIALAASAGIAAAAALASGKSHASAALALPRWWVKEALCIHRHESIDWHATRDWRGFPSADHGGMQIAVGTWLALAPKGFPREPASASPRQQLVVAYRIWRENGRRFGGSQWPYSSSSCGLD